MGLEVALDPAAAVEVCHGRAWTSGGRRRVVYARGNRSRRAGDLEVLDARERRRRLVHEADHRAELLAQLRQGWKVAGDADRLDELAHDLGLGIHRAAMVTDLAAG